MRFQVHNDTFVFRICGGSILGTSDFKLFLEVAIDPSGGRQQDPPSAPRAAQERPKNTQEQPRVAKSKTIRCVRLFFGEGFVTVKCCAHIML